MKKIFLAIMTALLFTSCMEDAEVWDSSVVDLAGDWNVCTYDKDGKIIAYYSQALTYNTAQDNGDMWVNLSGVLSIGEVSKVKTTGMTFSGSDVFTVSNGEVFLDGGSSKTGVMTDSIYMEVDVNGTSYIVSGHKRTGFTEDEY